jgi:alkylation response protein AidB-like acyl-CoA dehydrogenase
MNALNGGRITIAACALGVAKGALDVATAHAREREQFGKKIAEFQGVSFMLADMKVAIDAAELLVRRASALKDAELPFATEASMAKPCASRHAPTPPEVQASPTASAGSPARVVRPAHTASRS